LQPLRVEHDERHALIETAGNPHPLVLGIRAHGVDRRLDDPFDLRRGQVQLELA